jgi:hypothetical protein
MVDALLPCDSWVRTVCFISDPNVTFKRRFGQGIVPVQGQKIEYSPHFFLEMLRVSELSQTDIESLGRGYTLKTMFRFFGHLAKALNR